MCVGSWRETANLLKGPTWSPCWSASCQAGPQKKHADWLDLGFPPDFNQLQSAIHCPAVRRVALTLQLTKDFADAGIYCVKIDKYFANPRINVWFKMQKPPRSNRNFAKTNVR